MVVRDGRTIDRLTAVYRLQVKNVPLFFLHECIKVLSLQEQWEGRAPKHACNCQILASICQVSLHTHSCCRLLHQRNRLLHSHYGMEYFYLN